MFTRLQLQEVAGSDDSALRAVVAADVELMGLREEEAEILARQEGSENGDANGASNSADEEEEADSERLNEIYERMQASSFSALLIMILPIEAAVHNVFGIQLSELNHPCDSLPFTLINYALPGP